MTGVVIDTNICGVGQPHRRRPSGIRRFRLKFLLQDIQRFLAKVLKVAKVVVPTHTVDKCADESDNRFLECAEAAGADYLVTGNTRHFPNTYKKTKIVTARQLIDLLTATKK
jgi:predicted nucleic acid-binding protein